MARESKESLAPKFVSVSPNRLCFMQQTNIELLSILTNSKKTSDRGNAPYLPTHC